jgi:quercetin dioxygenase-like cupin family protein
MMDELPATLRGWMPASAAHGSGEAVRRLTGDELEMLVVDLADVPTPSAHSHDVEQIVVVLEGSVRMNLGGTERKLTAGDAIVIPPNLVHGAASAGPNVARLLEVRRYPNTTVGLA